jgi:hypothetical protein
VPWPLQEAINHGLSVLNWFENYVEDEIPPEPIWDDAEAITEWFKVIKKRHDDKLNFGAPKDDEDDDETNNSMMGNELADYFRK